MHHDGKDYQHIMAAIIKIQGIIRCWFAIRALKTELEVVQNQYATKIQCLIRGVQARYRYKRHCSARMIQKNWRGYIVHVDFMISWLSATTIQSCARRMIARCNFSISQHGVILMQGICRGIRARSAVQRMRESIIVIQSWTRRLLVTSTLRKHRSASIVIQRVARGMIARLDVEVQHYAATEIQRLWRGFCIHMNFITMVSSCNKIQSMVRQVAARKLLTTLKYNALLNEVDIRLRHRAAGTIQRAIRDFMHQKELILRVGTTQRLVRGFLGRRLVTKMKLGIILLQTVYRGHLVRLARSRKARAAAIRIKRANRDALAEPQMKLGVRTSSALVVLQTSKRLSEIMRAITTLEVSTRLSRKCCVAFAQADAPSILYDLIRSCNRSLPHIELLHYILLTLTNVASHSLLLPSIATETSIEILMDLIQMFRDKENVFCLAVSLMERIVFSGDEFMVSVRYKMHKGDFLSDPFPTLFFFMGHEFLCVDAHTVYNMIIIIIIVPKQIQCASRENVKRLQGIHSLCMRKISLSKKMHGRKSFGNEGVVDRKAKPKNNEQNSRVDLKQGIRSLENILSSLG